MNLRSYRRFLTVFTQFLPLLVAYLRDRRRFLLFGRSREVTAEMRRRRAGSLLDSLLTLGPTFIKFGQLLSTRPDILPPEYVAEFASLQDRVPPAEWAEAEGVLEAELGPVDQAFDSFDRDAISGASLGQVYRASYDGEEVAVKVRRPNIEALIEADLRVINWSVPVLLRFVGEARSFSLETLAEEFEHTIREEIDYDRERRVLEEIKGNFAGNGDIRIPEPIPERSTERVLTMEFVSGTKISDVDELDAMGIDRTKLAQRLERIYLQMIAEDGVFHADPHPGNLAVEPDGTIVFYDFGMNGTVDPYVQDRIIAMYIGIANGDTDAILDALIEMGTLSPNADRETMSSVMELAIQDIRGEEVEHYRVQEVIEQVEDTIYEFPLRLPANLALVLRVATVVEGVCVALDPNFDFVEVATEFLAEEGYREEGIRRFIEERTDEFEAIADATLGMPPKIDRALTDLNRGELSVRANMDDTDDLFQSLANRLIFGLLLTAGVLSTSMLYAFATTGSTVLAAVFSIGVGFLLWRSFRNTKASDPSIQAGSEVAQQSLEQRQSAMAQPDTRADEDGEDDLREGNEPMNRPERESAR